MEEYQGASDGSWSSETKCSNCNRVVSSTEVFCSNCSFPQHGTEEEKEKFERRVSAKKNLLNVVEKEVKKGRNTLIILGVLNAIWGLYYGFVLEDITTCVIQLILAILYLVLSTMVKKQPFGALLSGLILYLTLVLVLAVIEPLTLVSGVLWKVLIVVFLVKGIKSGHEARNIYRELEDLGVKEKEERF